MNAFSNLVELVNRISDDLDTAWNNGAEPTIYWVTAAELKMLAPVLMPEERLMRLEPFIGVTPVWHVIDTDFGPVTLIVRGEA